jgi:hypothetical protein
MFDPNAGSHPDGGGSVFAWADQWLQSDARHPTEVVGHAPPSESPASPAASTGANATDLSVSPTRFGGYEILERVGRGGMGTVYRARQLGLGRVVALKVISHGNWDDSSVRARFERESKVLAGVEHPNIVPVYDAGSWDGFPYFTMKYVPGGALNRHLDRLRADPAAAARLLAKVARAVHRLHQSGILHRDLKPHNILIGDGDEPLVADFGLVKRLGDDSDASTTGAPMGTRQYMSPEQTWGQKGEYTPACDVWALGVVLYELLAGARPFPSTDIVKLSIEIREAIPTPVAELNPAAPPGLVAVAGRCLAKKPGDRYPSAAAVADDLETWLAGGVVAAAPVAPAPPGRPVRRPRRGAAALVLAGLLPVGLLLDLPRSAQPPPPPDRPPQPAFGSVGKRLAAGEVVELVGPTGPPKVLPRPARDSGGLLADNPDKPCRFTSFQFGMLDLVDEPLPLPVRLEAEVALYTGRPHGSFTGVYVGRRRWAGADPYDSAVCCTLVAKQAPAGQSQEVAVLTSVWVGGGLPPVREQLALDTLPAPPAQEIPWRKVEVIITPAAVRAAWEGRPARERTEVETAAWAQTRARTLFPPPPPLVGPALGSGIGLTVGAGEGVFRNVRLVPIDP